MVYVEIFGSKLVVKSFDYLQIILMWKLEQSRRYRLPGTEKNNFLLIVVLVESSQNYLYYSLQSKLCHLS